MPKMLPSKGPYSPWSVGRRTLLARTCVCCGRLGDADSFPVIVGAGARRKVCHDCQNLQKKRDRQERGIGLPPGPRPPEDRQTARWQRWTKEEDQYLKDHLYDDMPILEIAEQLGRSTRAIYKRREILGLPAVRLKHRVEQPPWRIEQ